MGKSYFLSSTGIGNSLYLLLLHASRAIVADGTKEKDECLERVLTVDLGIGIARHVDAGYEMAVQIAREKGVIIPE